MLRNIRCSLHTPNFIAHILKKRKEKNQKLINKATKISNLLDIQDT